MNEPTDESLSNLLISFYTEDDEQAINQFFFSVKDLVFRFAFYITQNPETAETAVIHTFYQIYKKSIKCPANDRTEEKIISWILSLALTVTNNLHKKDKNKAGDAIHQRKISHKENLKQVLILRAVLQLPDKFKLPIMLHHKEDLTYGEIGQIFQLDQQTIKKNISSGVEQLKAILKDSGIALTGDLIVREIKVIKIPEYRPEFLNDIKVENLTNLNLKPITPQISNQTFMQWLTISVLIIPVFFGLIYLTEEIYSMLQSNTKTPTLPAKKTEFVKAPSNKKNWDFSHEDGQDFSIIKGNWIHNPSLGFMKTDYNATTLIQTPFEFQKTSSIYVFKINGFIFNPFMDRPISSRLCGYLVSEGRTIKYKFINHVTQINPIKKKLLNGIAIDYEVNLIVHQNGIFIVDNSNHFISSMIFTEPLPETCKIFLSFDNINTKKIDVETLDALPQEWETHINSVSVKPAE